MIVNPERKEHAEMLLTLEFNKMLNEDLEFRQMLIENMRKRKAKKTENS